jgi:5-methylcytosine-specific restriction protein B
MDSSLLDNLAAFTSKVDTQGDLPAQIEINRQLVTFEGKFGPEVLRNLDGDDLLQLMHGRQDDSARCLAYWLEFKNDVEFNGQMFGGIGGGSSLKFELFQRPKDGTWITGSPLKQRVIPADEAIAVARRHRDELLAASQVIAAAELADPSDAAYASLQLAVDKAAPSLSRVGWAHKYWSLIQPERIDAFHSASLQRFHLFKLLEMPPDQVGIRKQDAGRFLCAGRFVRIARELRLSMTALCRVLNRRHGGIHAYWKVGTTDGRDGSSHWDKMREGGFVSIGWASALGDMSELLTLDDQVARARIRERIVDEYRDAGTPTRKAGEIHNFLSKMSQGDIVAACNGQQVLGVGRIEGPYAYDRSHGFPHLRPVAWQTVKPWNLPEPEGPRTTVFQLGRSAANLLALERALADRRTDVGAAPSARQPFLPPATLSVHQDPFVARVEAALRRKGQVILYGPPGTGKTYRALAAARELASRQRHGRPWENLPPSEQAALTGDGGPVRLCTFHPGWGYEDFVEGLRPTVMNGQMAFQAKDGVFKALCQQAASSPDHQHFLVLDEINRSDLPRVFGELLTGLEMDKRGMEIVLPLSGSKLRIPRNIFLIGTMNTADRSISLLDAALRRRFSFIELMPDSAQLGLRRVGTLALAPWLDALNTRLRHHLKRDARNLQVGHAYLMPMHPITSMADLAGVLREDIIPLLEEYCYDDFALLEQILGSGLVDAKEGRIRDELFAPEREDDLLQALAFEEMSMLALSEQIPDEVPDDDAGEPDGEAEP